MSILKTARIAVAAAALAMIPAHAVAASAEPVRAVASMTEENEQSEGLGGYIIPVVIVLALGVGLYFAINGGDDDSPASA